MISVMYMNETREKSASAKVRAQYTPFHGSSVRGASLTTKLQSSSRKIDEAS